MDQERKFEEKMLGQAVFVEIRAGKWISKNHQLLRFKRSNIFMNIDRMGIAVSTNPFVGNK